MMDEQWNIGGEWDMSSDTSVSGVSVLAAFICGALTGLSIGVLLAPARGANTRRRMMSAARRGYRRTLRRMRGDRQNTPAIATVVGPTPMPASRASEPQG
jgi:hypothetical protein